MRAYGAPALTTLGAALLRAEGLGDEDALTVARDLVRANLRGLDSHGVARLPMYLGRLRRGLVARPRLVDRLVERSLLYRNVDATDRRRVVVHAAERGRALCRSLAPRIAAAERDGLAALSSAETRTLRRLLERLATP